MAFRVYSGPRGATMVSPLDKQLMLYKELDTLDAALAWARHVIDSGRTALLIEGDDGTAMTKAEIAAVLRHPDYADSGTPRLRQSRPLPQCEARARRRAVTSEQRP